MLDIESVSFRTHSATLLDCVDLRFEKGETVAIVGPNGAGKSTLLRLLSGDRQPTTGRIALKGRDLHSYPPRDLAARRAILSQHVGVAFPFTVEEIVRMGLPEGAGETTANLIDAVLDEVELSGFRHREFPTLSGGEQQRAHFARVLVQLASGESTNGSGILLLDEPTSSLDLRHQIKLVDIARTRATHGTLVIAVLHDINLAVRFANRIIMMHKGQIVGDGAPCQTITHDLIKQTFAVAVEVRHIGGEHPHILQQDMRAV